MNARNTCFWLAVAAALFFAILARQRCSPRVPAGPVKVLPGFKASAVTSISVQLKGQEPIRAERTNDTWRLTAPVAYPARSASIRGLLLALEQLTPGVFISAQERRSQPKGDEEEGLTSPQASLSIQQADSTIYQLHVGALTAPGDQLYLEVVAVAGVYVVDAALLKLIPRVQDDWRERALMDFKGLAFDHIAVTNRSGAPGDTKVIELQHDPGNHLWRIVNPPIRADAKRLNRLLEQLASLRVKQFVSDEPKAELEPLGLQLPRLELALARGTNTFALFQFGKSPTNDPALVYARRWGQNTILTVSTNALAGWQDQVSAFRATNVVDLPESVAAIEVFSGRDHFEVQQHATNHWLLLPENLPADTAACQALLSAFGRMPILDEPLDAETALDLARHGLAAPALRYVFKAAAPAAGGTNPVIAQVEIGATNGNRVFVRSTDESSVYAVKLADIQCLPVASYQMRERQIWAFSDDEITNVIVRQQGKVRQLLHPDKGPQSWTLAPGSTGTINPLAVHETMRYLAQLAATNWVAHGTQSRARYGFDDNDSRITLELKTGRKPVVELGGISPANSLYGAVALDGEPWIFEFPPALADWVQTFLLPPP
jgi:hypothetical protein